MTRALELRAYLELEGRNPIGTTSGDSAGVNHMTNQFVTDNTAVFGELVRSLKTDTNNIRTIETEDHALFLVAKSEIETASWTGESKMTHGETQEAVMVTTHEIPDTYTCLRAIDKTIALIHARDMEKDAIPESVGVNNKTDRYYLSHLAMTGDKIAKTCTLAAEMHKIYHNHHTKTDRMSLIQTLDDEATIIQTGPKTRYSNISKEPITLLENVKFGLSA